MEPKSKPTLTDISSFGGMPLRLTRKRWSVSLRNYEPILKKIVADELKESAPIEFTEIDSQKIKDTIATIFLSEVKKIIPFLTNIRK